ncbi:MAG: TadE/TadG family type IV pilus assembly protein [Alphaproteobacteria bacterium]|jgi:hypothetical protein
MQNLTSLLRLPKTRPRRFRLNLARFCRDDSGTVIVEAVIILPMLLWAYIALFVYWDAFRAKNTVQQAAYTVSDIISRERVGKTTAYIEGMQGVVDFMMDADVNARLRVTEVTWSDTNNRFEVHWSRSPGNAMPRLTTETLQAFAEKIPTMPAGDYAIVVELQADYIPAFDINLPGSFDISLQDQVFSEFIVARLRAIPCIPMDTAGVPNIVTCPMT